ncbi:MAG: BON domain-containing protein [Gemmatimonadaceae bacterium]|nr:BON domain-containing protein [Gemmatimonadaceae bacterium]
MSSFARYDREAGWGARGAREPWWGSEEQADGYSSRHGFGPGEDRARRWGSMGRYADSMEDGSAMDDARVRRQGLYGPNEYAGAMDGGTWGASFAGRGPKGWQRSDERMREDLNEALARHPGIDASEIEVAVDNGEITLSGTVRDRRHKRAAEDVAENIFGASEIQNHLRVRRQDDAERDDARGTSMSRRGESEQQGASGRSREGRQSSGNPASSGAGTATSTAGEGAEGRSKSR